MSSCKRFPALIPIALLTISHRPSLFKYHKYLLRLTGEDGFWEFSQLGTKSVLMNVDAEIRQLASQVNDEDGLRQRLTEVNDMLGVKKNAIKK